MGRQAGSTLKTGHRRQITGVWSFRDFKFEYMECGRSGRAAEIAIQSQRERESRQGRHTYTHRKWFHWHVVELLLIVLLSCCRYGCCCVGNRVRQSSRVSNNNKPSIRLPNYKIEGKHTEVKAKESGSSIGNMKKETGQRRKNLINQC